MIPAPTTQPSNAAEALAGRASLPYCTSRYRSVRRRAREVAIGNVVIGGDRPVALQSMTTTNTEDIAATVRQTLELAEAGCEIVRITAPTTRAARCLGEIRKQVDAAGIHVPLVADIHFTPRAALEAAEHVEKVRINPGNFADNKKFAVREYSDQDYERELQRLYEEFSPIVIRCRDLGRAMRIGTNHGSLSDRIMNRFGDTPEGMVQSALEFIRIAESHGYRAIVLSMKASNPKVMIEAYRLAVARMLEEDMHYPLHLGVTEAGDGEDARVKSAIGIGSLLYDGLGDTIRVSLTEDPVHEIPFARELATRAHARWQSRPAVDPGAEEPGDSIDPFAFEKRVPAPIVLSGNTFSGAGEPPRVIVPAHRPAEEWERIARDVAAIRQRFRDARIEGVLVAVDAATSAADLTALGASLRNLADLLVLEGPWSAELARAATGSSFPVAWCTNPGTTHGAIESWLRDCRTAGVLPVCDLSGTTGAPSEAATLASAFAEGPSVVCLSDPRETLGTSHPLGAHRALAEALRRAPSPPAFWIRNRETAALQSTAYFTARLAEASLLSGALLCDGIGDWISVETEADPARATALAYNVLQGARTRATRTEYVACPSCGRTLFDLQSTTQKIRSRTEHLKGVTIAVMGCIVNGPGEMADADFGYVGGAPGKVNLYVGKTCVTTGIPEAEAVDRLIDLIRANGRWVEP